MTDPLDALPDAARRTVAEFMRRCLELDGDGAGELFAPEATFVGVLTAGGLKGPVLIEAHLRQVFRKAESPDAFQVHSLEVSGSRAIINWGRQPAESKVEGAAKGQTILDLDPSGLIGKATIEWNPRHFLRFG